MNLKEWLMQNHGVHCHYAGNITESVQNNEDDKPRNVKVAEVWCVPIALLNKEIEVK